MAQATLDGFGQDLGIRAVSESQPAILQKHVMKISFLTSMTFSFLISKATMMF